jgi:hypothetical protein
MNATTTQLLSSGEFCKLRYETITVKSASANVSFYTNNSKMPNFELGHSCRKWTIYFRLFIFMIFSQATKIEIYESMVLYILYVCEIFVTFVENKTGRVCLRKCCWSEYIEIKKKIQDQQRQLERMWKSYEVFAPFLKVEQYPTRGSNRVKKFTNFSTIVVHKPTEILGGYRQNRAIQL